MLRALIMLTLLLVLASHATPHVVPVAHDNPIIFGEPSAPVEVVAWLGLRDEQSKTYIEAILPKPIDGAVNARKARVGLEPVANVDGTLPAVSVLWCVQNSIYGDLAARSTWSLLLLQAMQGKPTNGFPGYGEAWWLEQSAATAGLAHELVTGCLHNALAVESVGASYLAGKAGSLRNKLLLPQVSVNGQVVNVLDTPSVTFAQIEQAIAKAGQ